MLLQINSGNFYLQMFFTLSLTAASFHSLPPLSDFFISLPLFSALLFTSPPFCSALFFPCCSLAFTAVPFCRSYYYIIFVLFPSLLICLLFIILFYSLFLYVRLLLYYFHNCLIYKYSAFPFLIALFFLDRFQERQSTDESVTYTTQ